MRGRLIAGFSTLALFAVSGPAAAHHAFGAEFDANKPLKFEGTVTKVEWINPHTWIHIDVKKPDGSVEAWMVEGGTPNTLFRRGINKNSIPNGTLVVVDGYQAKDGSRRMNGRDLRFPDGRTLVVVTADHGESLGEHGEATHSHLVYDATQHVPLLLRGPGLSIVQDIFHRHGDLARHQLKKFELARAEGLGFQAAQTDDPEPASGGRQGKQTDGFHRDVAQRRHAHRETPFL